MASERPYFLVKCLFLGDAGVGKTSIIHRRTRNQIEQVKQVEVNYVSSSRSASPVTGAISTFDMADLNNLKDNEWEDHIAKYLTPPYDWEQFGGRSFLEYEAAQSKEKRLQQKPCIVVVFDMTNRASFDHIKHWVDLARKYGGEDIYIVLAATKIDLHHHVSREEADALAAKMKLNIYYINSADRVDKSGVLELFGDMLDEIHVRKGYMEAAKVAESRLKHAGKQNSSRRCIIS